MKKLILLLLLITVASPAVAQSCLFVEQMAIEPNPAWYGEDIEVRLSGTCSDGVNPFAVRVTSTGSTIVLDLGQPGGPIVNIAWGERVVLGKLLPGTYELIVRMREDELRREMFEVKPRPFTVAPMFGPPGTRVVLRGVDINCPPQNCNAVRFGGIPAENYDFHENGEVTVTVPSHQPGVVDVTFHDGDAVFTIPGGFRYGEAASEADFDRVMFPTTLAAKGAHGSDWHTEIIVQNDGPVQIATEPRLPAHPPFPGTPITLPIPPGGKGGVPENTTDGGMFFYVPRGAEGYLSYASHIVDRSRSTTDRGTEMPVIRAGDTAAGIRIPEVPIDERYRVRLRVYDFDALPRTVTVQVIADDETLPPFNLPLQATRIVCPTAPCLQPDPAFASIDLSSLEALRGKRIADLRISAGLRSDARLWAFATVTNNETQRVTLYTPQQKTPQP